MTKEIIDSTLSRNLELLTLPPTTPASWGAKGHWGKATAGMQLGWSVSLQNSNGEGHSISKHRQSQGRHVHIFVFIY